MAKEDKSRDRDHAFTYFFVCFASKQAKDLVGENEANETELKLRAPWT